MKKGELYIGRWQFKLGIIAMYYRPREYMAQFGILKLIEIPSVGETIQPKHYKGFWFTKTFNFDGFGIN